MVGLLPGRGKVLGTVPPGGLDGPGMMIGANGPVEDGLGPGEDGLGPGTAPGADPGGGKRGIEGGGNGAVSTWYHPII